MGYTHYWTHRRNFTPTQWTQITGAVRAIVAEARNGVAIIKGPDGTGEPEFGTDTIMFNGNGKGDLAHETFAIYRERKPLESWQRPEQRGWDFCKTARKPYDSAVVACLCYLTSLYPAKFTASSDGTPEEWADGLALAKRALPDVADWLHVPETIED